MNTFALFLIGLGVTILGLHRSPRDRFIAEAAARGTAHAEKWLR